MGRGGGTQVCAGNPIFLKYVCQRDRSDGELLRSRVFLGVILQFLLRNLHHFWRVRGNTRGCDDISSAKALSQAAQEGRNTNHHTNATLKCLHLQNKQEIPPFFSPARLTPKMDVRYAR